MSVKIAGNIKDTDTKRTIEGIINEINRETDELTATYTGAEVAVAHGLNYVPTSFRQVCKATTTGTGVLSPGTTAWTATHIYVVATANGVYHLRVRR